MNATETPRVMVVDDEEMVVTSLESFFTLETSYEILAYTSPERALDDLEDGSVHVVVADFMMPEMDGIEFLKKVREESPAATRILLTGYADKENAIRAINEAGLYYYLEKPWDNEHLLVVIRNAIERSTLFNELSARVSALEASHDELQEMRQKLIRAFL